MKSHTWVALAALMGGMLLAVDQFLGRGVLWFTGGFAGVWFAIAMILLSRPPGFPEFVSEQPGSDEQFVVRHDVVPKLPWLQRFNYSLTVACGACLTIWLTLILLGR